MTDDKNDDKNDDKTTGAADSDISAIDEETTTGKNEDVPDGSGHGSAESGEDTASGGPA